MFLSRKRAILTAVAAASVAGVSAQTYASTFSVMTFSSDTDAGISPSNS
jgi:hypothetical protein